MGKTLGKIVIWLMPVLLVYGLFRFFANGEDAIDQIGFLPSYADLVKVFSSAPDFLAWIKEDIASIQDFASQSSKLIGDSSSVVVNDWDTFWQSWSIFFDGVGKFFSLIGVVFRLLFHVIEVPFMAITWFFYSFLSVGGPDWKPIEFNPQGLWKGRIPSALSLPLGLV